MKPDELQAVRERLSVDPRKLGEEIDQSIAGVTAEEQKNAPDPREQREYTFELRWKDGRGKLWIGTFVNRILSIRDRQVVGLTRARMSPGVSSDQLDGLTGEVNLMLAHLSVSLIKRPEWANDLGNLDDVRLLQEIYMEVLAHEATFFGYAKTAATSGTESGKRTGDA